MIPYFQGFSTVFRNGLVKRPVRGILDALATQREGKVIEKRRYIPRNAVEDRASGAALFDGNDQNTVSWLFANDNWEDDRVPHLIDQLMEFTIVGNLAWVVFPKYGWRME